MEFMDMIILMIISYFLVFILLLVYTLHERKDSLDLRIRIINIISQISKLHIKIESEINVHETKILSGQIFDLYKEILLMIASSKNERMVRDLIEDELSYSYKKYYKNYVITFGNEDRYGIINHYISKWTRSAR